MKARHHLEHGGEKRDDVGTVKTSQAERKMTKNSMKEPDGITTVTDTGTGTGTGIGMPDTAIIIIVIIIIMIMG